MANFALQFLTFTVRNADLQETVLIFGMERTPTLIYHSIVSLLVSLSHFSEFIPF